MKLSYQEDLRKWVEGPERTAQEKESEEDRRTWIKMQAEQLYQEINECTLPELEGLCKKKGILIWAVKYYTPDFFEAVIEKSRMCAMQEIVEEVGIEEWCSPHQLRTLIKQKNKEYGLNRYHGEISCDDLEKYDLNWFHTAFKQRFITLADIIEEEGSPPRFRRVLD